jgi:arylsulfatase A-like enzyme
MTFSNPVLFPEPLQSDQLVSIVDLLPTLATLLDAPKSAWPKKHKWAGVDFSSVVLNQGKTKPVQDYQLFTWDDYPAGQAKVNGVGLWPREPAHLVALREKRWKIAMYYDPAEAITKTPRQWELYDMQTDPDGT